MSRRGHVILEEILLIGASIALFIVLAGVLSGIIGAFMQSVSHIQGASMGTSFQSFLESVRSVISHAFNITELQKIFGR